MKIEITIPSVGESVTEATISRILVPSGSQVKVDEEIVELETDKVNQVLPAPKAGKLELTVKVGDVVKIGQVIGSIDTASQGTAPEVKKEASSPSAPPQPISSQETSRKMVPEFIAEMKQPSSPPPKKEEKTYSREEAAPGTTRKKMSGLRKTIAERLVMAKNQTAMLTTFNEVDMTQVMQIRDKEKETFFNRNGVKLGFMSFFLKAVVAALKAIPEVNASIDGDEMVLYQTYDIGVAVSTDKGLMVPVIKGCEALTFAGIEGAIENFAKKARNGSLKIDDLRGGSFTITNGGTFGSLLSTPILNPPQSAILGMHKIQKRPVVIDNQIVIRPMMYLALSYDHRIIDGKEAVQFLVHVKEAIEDPARLLLGE